MNGGTTTNPHYGEPLPFSEDAERAILGSILIDHTLLQQAASVLGPDDFYDRMHKHVFGAMIALEGARRGIDPILIAEEVKRTDSSLPVSGAAITNLTWGLPHFEDISEYIGVVRDRSARRRLIQECSEIVQSAITSTDDSASLLADAQNRIRNILHAVEAGQAESYFRSLKSLISDEVVPALHDLTSGVTTRISTGFPKIDQCIGGGISRSDVLLIAADTGKGKSAFALQTAFQIASNSIPTAFLAGEMSNRENVLRLLSQLSDSPNLNARTQIDDWEQERLVKWADFVSDVPIYFESRISDMQELRIHLKRVVRRHEVQVLVVDYIQLFKMERLDRRKRHERIAEVSQELKRLASELGIAIIEVAQFNREGAKSGNAGLHDLEGSGQLEKDASIVFLLSLGDPEFSEGNGRSYRDATVRIVKGRNVGSSQTSGRFYGRSLKFNFD